MNSHTLHSIDSLGISKVSLSSIRVERLEDRLKPKVGFPHKHDFFQIMLIISGSGYHTIDFKRHRVQKNQLFIMKPGQIHTWQLDPGIKGIIVEFNHHSLPMMISQLSFTPDVWILKKGESFHELLKLMLEESNGQLEHQDLSLRSYLTNMLIMILRSCPTVPRSEGILEKFRSLVEKNFKTEHRVEFYAKELGITPKALTMKVSRLLGKSPRLIIQDRFLLEAKRFLAYSNLSIAEIGYEVGFEDANYFTRFFRLHERMTPAQFRQKSLTQS